MAIIITRGLTSLVSVFNQQSIEFTVPNGTANVAVSIGAYTFIPIRTSTVTVDTYYMDLSDILKYILGLPNGTDLSASCTVSISATGQTTVTTTGRLCFGYDQIGYSDLVDYVEDLGAKDTIYHNGDITFYSKTSGTYTGTMNAHSQAFSLVVGYNTIHLPTQWLVNGVLEFSGTNIRLSLNYRQGVDNVVTWIDEEGRISRWNFRLLNKTFDTAHSNSIPSYYQTLALTKEKSTDISTSKNLLLTMDTVAVDVYHYEQLCKIKESLYVTWQGERMNVKSSDSLIAECRQNLHFTITLEQEQYVPTY